MSFTVDRNPPEYLIQSPCLRSVRELLGRSRRQMSEVMNASPHRIGQIDSTPPDRLVVGTLCAYLGALGMNTVFRFAEPGLARTFDCKIGLVGGYPDGISISKLRTLRGITQKEMGSRCGVSQSRISHIEGSDIRRLKILTVRRYANACGADMTILGWDPETNIEVEVPV